MLLSNISSSSNAFWKNPTLVNVTDQIDKVCEFFQNIQLYSLLGFSGINVCNHLKNKEFFPLINNILGKSQLIDALGIFQLLGNIQKFDKKKSGIALASEISSMCADVLYFPVALQELNLINLERIALKIGRLSLLNWVPKQSSDKWVNAFLFFKYYFQFISNLEVYCNLKKTNIVNKNEKSTQMKTALCLSAVGFAEAVYYMSTLTRFHEKNIDRLMFIAKLTGVISSFFLPKD